MSTLVTWLVIGGGVAVFLRILAADGADRVDRWTALLPPRDEPSTTDTDS